MFSSILTVILLGLTNASVDSIELKKRQISTANDSLKTQLYIQLSEYYDNKNPELLKAYLDSAINLAEKIQNKRCLADAYHTQGGYLMNVGNFDDAIIYYEKTLALRREINDEKGVFKAHSNLGIIYVRTGKYNLATEYFFKALDYAEEKNDSRAIADCMGYLGHLNYYQKKFEKALKYHKIAKRSFLKVEGYRGARIAEMNIGIAYYQLNNKDSALYHYQLALDSNIVANDIFGQSHCYNNLGQIYKDAGDHDKAIGYLTKGLNIRKQFKDTTGVAYGYHYMAGSYVALGKYKQGIELLMKAVELSEKMNFTELLKSSFLSLSEVHEEIGNYKKSLNYHKKVLAISDTILTKEKINSLENAQTKYETEKKEKEIELLTSKTKIQNLQIQKNQYMAAGIGGVAILLIISIVALYSRRNYKLKAVLAKEKESRQKSRFKAIIEGEEKERKRIAQELHDGLGQLLSTARLNVSVLEDNTQETNTIQLNNSLKLIDEAVNEVRNISHNMMPNALISIGFEAALKEQVHLINDTGKVKVQLTISDETVNLEESKAISLYRIIQEILNNALKYSSARNILINIKYSEQSNIEITIKDDGRGFDTKVIETSSGIGWENIVSRTDLLNGQLDIRSEIGKGSQVYLKLAV